MKWAEHLPAQVSVPVARTAKRAAATRQCVIQHPRTGKNFLVRRREFFLVQELIACELTCVINTGASWVRGYQLAFGAGVPDVDGCDNTAGHRRAIESTRAPLRRGR